MLPSRALLWLLYNAPRGFGRPNCNYHVLLSLGATQNCYLYTPPVSCSRECLVTLHVFLLTAGLYELAVRFFRNPHACSFFN